MFNKRNVHKINGYKIRRRWVNISLAVLMIGGVFAATHINASADTINHQTVTTQPKSKVTLAERVTELHNQPVRQALKLGSRHGRSFNHRRSLRDRHGRSYRRLKHNLHCKSSNRNYRRSKSRLKYVSRRIYNRYNRQLKRDRYLMRHGSRRTRQYHKRLYYRLRDYMKRIRIRTRHVNHKFENVSVSPNTDNQPNSTPQNMVTFEPNTDNQSNQQPNVPSNDQSSDNVSTQDQIDTYLQQYKQQTFNDLNKDRAANGVAPLTENSALDNLASLRAQQLTTNFSHYNSNGQPSYTEEAPQFGLNSDYHEVAENIAAANLGETGMVDNPNTYYNQNGSDMANMDEDSMMNYDQGHGNGHRDNILNNALTSVGIGTAYDPSTDTYYLAEDFRG